jgi:hypothetical protein
VYFPAREKAGQSDLQFHDLCPPVPCWPRFTGATLAELMARLGYSTSGAALRSDPDGGPRVGPFGGQVPPV